MTLKPKIKLLINGRIEEFVSMPYIEKAKRTDAYVKQQLKQRGWKEEDITSEIIETKRLLLKTKRLIKLKEYEKH